MKIFFSILFILLLSYKSYASDKLESDSFSGIIFNKNSMESHYPPDNKKLYLMLNDSNIYINPFDSLAFNNNKIIGLSLFSSNGLKTFEKNTLKKIKLSEYFFGPSMRGFGDKKPNSYLYLTENNKAIIGFDWGDYFRIVDLDKNETIFSAFGKASNYTPISVSYNNLVTTSYENLIKIREKNTGKIIKKISGYNGSIIKSIFYKNKIIAITYSKNIKVIDIDSGNIQELQGHTSNVSAIDVYDDKIISAASDRFNDKSLKVWDINTGNLIKTFPMPTYYAASFLKIIDNKIVTGGWGESSILTVMDLETGKLLNSFEPFTHVNAISSINSNIVTGTEKSIQIWDIDHGKIIKESQIESHPTCFYFDGTYLFSGHKNGKVLVWDIKNLNIIKEIDLKKIPLSLFIHKNELFSTHNDNSQTIWNIKKSELLNTVKIDNDFTNIIYADENIVISNADNQIVDIWDIDKTKIIHSLKNFNSQIFSATIKDNILALGLNKKIAFFDINTGIFIKEIDAHLGNIISLCFTEDGNVISSSTDQLIKIWDYKKEELLSKIDIPNLTSNKVMSYQNFLVISQYYEDKYTNKITVWDIKNNKLLYSIKDNVSSFTLDKNNLLINLSNGNFKKINLFSGKVIDESKVEQYKSSFINTEDKIFLFSNILNESNNSKNYNYSILDLNNLSFSKQKNFKNNIEMINLYDNKILRILDNKENFTYLDINKDKIINKIDSNLNISFITEDEDSILRGFKDGSIELLNIKTGKKYFYNKYDNEEITYLKKVKNYLVSGNSKKIYSIWNIENNKLIRSIKLDKSITSFDIENDNFAVILNEQEVKVFSIKSGKLKNKFSKKYPKSEVYDEKLKYFSIKLNDTKAVLASSSSYFIEVWDLKTNKNTLNIKEKDFIRDLHVFKNNIFSFYSASNSKEYYSLNIWDINTGNIIYKNNESLKLIKDNLIVTTSGEKTSSTLFEMNNNLVIKKIPVFFDSFLDKQKYLGFSQEGYWEINDLKNSKYLKRFPIKNFVANNFNIKNNKLFCEGNNSIYIFSLNTGKILSIVYIFPTATFIITNEGYFTGDGNFDDYVYLVKNDKSYSLNQFKSFNNKKIVEDIINEKNKTNLPKLWDL